MSVLILPAALIAALFSRDLLLLWTQNPVTAENTHMLLSLLVIGTALNGLMHMPYALQLAHGWTSLAFYTNVAAVAILAPSLIVLTLHYGAVGAASVWVILNSGYVLITIQIMHRRLLPGEKWRWYTRDVAMPLVVSLTLVAVGRWLLPSHLQALLLVVYLVLLWLAAVSTALLTTSQLRTLFFGYLAAWRVNFWRTQEIS